MKVARKYEQMPRDGNYWVLIGVFCVSAVLFVLSLIDWCLK